MKRMTAGAIVVAVLVLFSAVVLFAHPRESALPFDAEAWNHQGDSNQRLRMVSDLKLKLMRMSKAEVKQLLGEPVTNVGLYPGDYYYYVLGTQKRFGDTDGIWLCLKFINDRVDAVQVAHD